MRYDLDDLRLFVHIAAEGSITAGAGRMHLSLPSASARVRALERQAGVALLVRERRGVRLTPAGSTLARHAQEVLQETARLEGAVASYQATPGRSLVLVAGGAAIHWLVRSALVSFLRENPDVDVTVAEHRTPRSLRILADGEADLGVVIEHEARDCGLETEPVGDDSLVVIGRVGGVLAGRQSLAYREVTEHPLVGLDPRSSLRRWIENQAGPRATVPRYRTTVANLDTVVALAAAGAGLAVVPRRAVSPDQPVEICDLEDPWSRRTHLLAWGAGRKTPECEALATQLRRAARDGGH